MTSLELCISLLNMFSILLNYRTRPTKSYNKTCQLASQSGITNDANACKYVASKFALPALGHLRRRTGTGPNWVVFQKGLDVGRRCSRVRRQCPLPGIANSPARSTKTSEIIDQLMLPSISITNSWPIKYICSLNKCSSYTPLQLWA
jgi:hypothetical protein